MEKAQTTSTAEQMYSRGFKEEITGDATDQIFSSMQVSQATAKSVEPLHQNADEEGCTWQRMAAQSDMHTTPQI